MLRLACGRRLYGVAKESNGGNGLPLPSMDMFYLKGEQGQKLSFWNDPKIAVQGDRLTCGIEVPKELSNKFEVIKELPGHPIMQDTRKNLFTKQLQLRHYAPFPLFNYGFVPQTWQQNIAKDKLGLYGDNDPLDIVDLSKQKKATGDIFRAKILGSFCLIDQGETDWKVLTVDAGEAQKDSIMGLQDYPKEQVQAVMQWFKTIKVFDGKKQNSIAYDQKIFSVDETLAMIWQTHQEWRKLVTSQDQVYRQLRLEFQINQVKVE